MDIIELTNKVYRQTLLFPKKEPLRYKTREIADNILAKMVEWNVGHSPNPGKLLALPIEQKRDLIFEIEKDLELIKSYFKLAKWQNWVSYFDIIKLEDEYTELEKYFKDQVEQMTTLQNSSRCSSGLIAGQGPQKTEIIAKTKTILDERKKKILEILKEKKKIQVKEVKEAMPAVSKRTIRRDFDALLESGLVKRLGESNNTFYELKQ